MNTQPVSYLQTDARWKNISYSAKGESTTIGASGCGPTAMSMVLATWADKKVTPKTECAWALAHGYKAPHQGTYYGYFKPAAARYGLTAYMLNGANIYGNSSSKYHNLAKAEIDKGNLVIACMGKGLWTSSGHFILVWNIQGNTIYINDPNSTKTARTRGNYSLFKQQVKYYFIIEKPKTNNNNNKPTIKQEEDEDMTQEKFNEMMNNYLVQLAKQNADWGKDELNWAVSMGLIKGDETGKLMPNKFLTRLEGVTIMKRLYDKLC